MIVALTENTHRHPYLIVPSPRVTMDVTDDVAVRAIAKTFVRSAIGVPLEAPITVVSPKRSTDMFPVASLCGASPTASFRAGRLARRPPFVPEPLATPLGLPEPLAEADRTDSSENALWCSDADAEARRQRIATKRALVNSRLSECLALRSSEVSRDAFAAFARRRLHEARHHGVRLTEGGSSLSPPPPSSEHDSHHQTGSRLSRRPDAEADSGIAAAWSSHDDNTATVSRAAAVRWKGGDASDDLRAMAASPSVEAQRTLPLAQRLPGESPSSQAAVSSATTQRCHPENQALSATIDRLLDDVARRQGLLEATRRRLEAERPTSALLDRSHASSPSAERKVAVLSIEASRLQLSDLARRSGTSARIPRIHVDVIDARDWQPPGVSNRGGQTVPLADVTQPDVLALVGRLRRGGFMTDLLGPPMTPAAAQTAGNDSSLVDGWKGEEDDGDHRVVSIRGFKYHLDVARRHAGGPPRPGASPLPSGGELVGVGGVVPFPAAPTNVDTVVPVVMLVVDPVSAHVPVPVPPSWLEALRAAVTLRYPDIPPTFVALVESCSSRGGSSVDGPAVYPAMDAPRPGHRMVTLGQAPFAVHPLTNDGVDAALVSLLAVAFGLREDANGRGSAQQQTGRCGRFSPHHEDQQSTPIHPGTSEKRSERPLLDRVKPLPADMEARLHPKMRPASAPLSKGPSTSAVVAKMHHRESEYVEAVFTNASARRMVDDEMNSRRRHYAALVDRVAPPFVHRPRWHAVHSVEPTAATFTAARGTQIYESGRQRHDAVRHAAMSKRCPPKSVRKLDSEETAAVGERLCHSSMSSIRRHMQTLADRCAASGPTPASRHAPKLHEAERDAAFARARK